MRRALHHPDYRRFVRQLREAREAGGITQVELAQRLRTTQTYVSRVERCERRLDVVEFLAWGRALGIDCLAFLRNFKQK